MGFSADLPFIDVRAYNYLRVHLGLRHRALERRLDVERRDVPYLPGGVARPYFSMELDLNGQPYDPAYLRAELVRAPRAYHLRHVKFINERVAHAPGEDLYVLPVTDFKWIVAASCKPEQDHHRLELLFKMRMHWKEYSDVKQGTRTFSV